MLNIKKLPLFLAYFGVAINFIYYSVSQFLQVLPYEVAILILDGLILLYGVCAGVIAQISRTSEIDKIPEMPKYQAEMSSSLQYTDKMLIDNIPNILCIKDKEGRWLQASAKYLHSFNLQGIDYIGKTDLELAQHPGCHIAELSASANLDKNTWQQCKALRETRVIAYNDEPEESITIVRAPLFDAENNRYRLILTGHFVDQAEIEKSEHDLMSAMYHDSHLSYIVCDQNFKITDVNSAFSLLTGYQRVDAVGQSLSSIFAEDNVGLLSSLETFFVAGERKLWAAEFECLHDNGRSFASKLEVMPLINQDENAAYQAVLYDTSKQKLNEKRIMRIAHYDDLTGLANRIMFFDRLSQFLSAAKRHRLHAVIFFIDLDRFKAVNDSLGHDAGDELLKETAKRLIAITRKEDIVARLSGDEFALLLLNEKSHEQAIYSSSMIAEKVIQTLSEKFYIKRREVFIGSSVGISIFPEDGATAEGLVKHADIAMYEAKNNGRNNYQFFKKEFTMASKDRVSLENNLRKALGKSALHLYYQPQYVAETKEIWGAEVLIRWFHIEESGRKNLIPPDHFIPIAEETGLIIEIGRWILERACTQLKYWIDNGYPLRQVSVNISARQFMDPGFLHVVEDVLLKTQLPPENLELEITESMLIGDAKRIELILNRLKGLGLKLALDDFGTGYSSLSYLKNFPIDILKIDQSFVKELKLGSKDARIARAIIDMGHSLGQKVVAEGVETEAQLRYLCQRNCDIIQGYYFSAPLPEHKMTALLQADVLPI